MKQKFYFYNEEDKMSENNHGKPGEISVVSKSAQALIDDALNAAFDTDPDTLQTFAEEKLQELDHVKATEDRDALKAALQSVWYFAQAVNVAFRGGDFVVAVDLLDRAASGFDQLGQTHARDISVGLGAYAQSVLDVRAMNITRAFDRLQAVEVYLNKAGTFSSKYKPLVDHMKPEMLLIASLLALQQLDLATGRTLIEEASKAANNVADVYYTEGRPERLAFRGYAHLYRAFYDFFRSISDSNQFEYDRIVANAAEVNANARSASDLLRQVEGMSEPVRIASVLATGVSQFLEAIPELARIMKKVFDSSFTTALPGLSTLRNKIHLAGETLAKAGPQATAMVRFTEQVANQVRNLERLARPTKKDFGVYSGLVTTAAFAALFLLTSWANAIFGLNLSSVRLITTCAVIGLIAGFGFGALRFRSLLFPAGQKDKDSD
ncbi:MAG: hypothetical protein L3J18_17955 [Candidatus Brocadia sp.]|nr:MAG: hypothetical protein L3J18_17955 [Candidatus Brocadia sp.]